ncbi:MOB kinase activator-like 3 isoform X1 [Drosophila tropicalis]|uniref:MOB kinase activator-like 3 isoform X1 n=1 Tax=Drosophila tropicalis TaxID=46794 RepID=UPI0035AC057E
MSLNGFLELFHQGRTFRPKKRFTSGTIRYSLHKQAQASLQSGINLRQVVRLPEGENLNDWLAVHVVDFFNRINLIYGTVSEYCNDATCPTMSGGSRYEYLWVDGTLYKKPTALPAKKYIELLMEWIETQINNEAVFPVSTDSDWIASVVAFLSFDARDILGFLNPFSSEKGLPPLALEPMILRTFRFPRRILD